MDNRWHNRAQRWTAYSVKHSQSKARTAGQRFGFISARYGFRV